MVIPLIPVAIVAGAGALGVGTFFGIKNKKPQTYTTIKTTNQYDYTSNIVTWDFSGAVIEKGGVSGLTTDITTTTKKYSKQEDAPQLVGGQTDSLLLLGLVGAGAFLILGGKK